MIKTLVFLICDAVTLVAFFKLFASNDNAIAYRLVSRYVLGREPTHGDGAFQFPIAWILLIVLGFAAGTLLGYLISHFADLK